MPDVVINVVDASNIERNLYLTTQVIDMNLRTVIALNRVSFSKIAYLYLCYSLSNFAIYLILRLCPKEYESYPLFCWLQ